MKGFYLTEAELTELHAAHRSERNKHRSYKIHAVILLGTGYTLKKVREVLFLDDETLRGYVDKYREEGIDSLLRDGRGGRDSLLNEEQRQLLCQELDSTIHLDTDSIIFWVKTNFGIEYSRSGMRDLLHRLNYVYKKPKLVPGKPDIEEQEFFAAEYEKFMQEKSADTVVVFSDAVHPEHNTIAGYGWIKRGEVKELKTNSGRERLNLHGGINAETHEVTVIESKTVDAYSTINLFSALLHRYQDAKEIVVILDNAKYHYANVVQEYLEKHSKLKLAFLPSYSPNLNLIERLWKFFKGKVLYNRYHKNIAAFRKACIDFFRNIHRCQDEIANFMDADFHIA